MPSLLAQPQRISVTIPGEVSPFLVQRAKKENISLPKAVVAFIMDAIASENEKAEDAHYLELAEKRDKETKKYYTREEVRQAYGI